MAKSNQIDMKALLVVAIFFSVAFLYASIYAINLEHENDDLKIQIKETSLNNTLHIQHLQREIQIKDMQADYQKELLKICRGW